MQWAFNDSITCYEFFLIAKNFQTLGKQLGNRVGTLSELIYKNRK